MTPQRSTASSASDGPLEEVVEVVEDVEDVEGIPVDDSFRGSMVGSGNVGAGAVATGNLTAAGVASSKRDWIVPVIRGASSATFQRRSDAAGSRRRPRVTSQAIPRSAVLWIKYVRSQARRLEVRLVIWTPFRHARSCRGSWRCRPGSCRRPRAGVAPGR